MSAIRPSRRGETQSPVQRAQLRNISQLQARRRAANRRRRLARLDVGLGVLAAIVLLVLTPGLAIAGVLAGLVLVGCVLSVVVEQRRRRKRQL